MTITHRPLTVLLAAGMLAACNPAPDAGDTANTAASQAGAPVKNADVHPFAIGDMRAFALADAVFEIPNDGKTLGLGHTTEEIAQVLAAAHLPADPIKVDVHPLLVTSGDLVMLFDTGVGAGSPDQPGKLAASMAAAGVAPANVTDIFISHAHGDHIGGLMDAEGGLAFPRAIIHISSAEWVWLKDQAEKDESAAALVAAITPKIAPFAPNAEILPGKVIAVDIPGHTPGHSGYRILSGSDSLLYVGDAVHHHVISVRKPDWPIEFDGDKPAATASRDALLRESAESGQRLYAVHFPFPNVGTVKPDGDGFIWVPE